MTHYTSSHEATNAAALPNPPLLLGEFGRAAIVYFSSYYTSLHFMADGLRFAAAADWNPITMVGGLAILVIAEVFQEGARLQEEQSLTI